MSVTLTIQPNITAGVDTFITSASPTTNFGTGNVLQVGVTTTDVARALIRFDLSDIPDQAEIVSAALVLTVQDNQLTGSPDFRAHTLSRQDWSESQATWQIYKTGSAWTAAGGDFDAASAASQTNNLVVSTLTILGLGAQATAAIEDTDALLHLLVKRSSETVGANNYADFHASDDNNNPTLVPKLVVVYQPCPIVERIARKLATRLAQVSEVNGYTFDAEVDRPQHLGQNFAPLDKQVVLVQGPRRKVADLEPGLVQWEQDFAVLPIARASDHDSTPIETLINRREADCHLALTTPEQSGHDWRNIDGLAVEASFGDPEDYLLPDGQPAGVVTHLLVQYRTPENDPCTVAL